MSKTLQVLKVKYGGFGFHVVFHTDEPVNPFWVYEDGWNHETHRPTHKMVVKYADLASVMCFLYQNFMDRYRA